MKNIKYLHERFEIVTLQVEKLEIKRDLYIEKNKDTSFIDDKIFNLEIMQGEIQDEIEELELCS